MDTVFVDSKMVWGVIVGFEDYSGKELIEVLDKPTHAEFRYIVDTGAEILYCFNHEVSASVEVI